MKKKDNLMNDAAVFFLVAVISVSLSVFVGEVKNFTNDNVAQVVGSATTTSQNATDLQREIINLQAQLASISKNPQDVTMASTVSALQVMLATLQTKLASLSPQIRPFVSITTPNGGEALEIGKTYRIKWQASPEIDKVNVAYSYGSGDWNRICVACANTGFFDWDVQVGSTTSGQIKIDLTGFKTGYGSVNDQSDNFLRIIKDNASPKISITAAPTTIPLGTVSLLTANVSDDTGVTGVQFKLNGAQYGAEVKTYPYTISFSPPNTSNPYNSYEVTAVARDTVGKIGFSNSVPVIVVPATGSTSTTSTQKGLRVMMDSSDPSFSGIKNVVVPASGVRVAKFKFTGVNSAFIVGELKLKIPSDASTSTSLVTIKYKDQNGQIQSRNQALVLPFGQQQYATATFAGLSLYVPQNGDGFLEVYVDLSSIQNGAKPGVAVTITLDHATGFKAVSSDGSIIQSFGLNDVVGAGTIIVTAPSTTSTTTPPTADLPPMVALSALPSLTASVGSEVVLNAAVYDDKGIYSVQFMINGVNQGLGIATIPNRIYKFSQVFAAPGTYTVSAIVKDIAGNTTTSNSILVTAVASPTSGTGTGTASGTVPGGK